MDLAKVMLAGRACADPEMKSLPGGGRVAKIRFVMNHRRKNKSTGEWEDDPVFLDVNAFNNGQNTLADRVEKMIRKGGRLFVEGRLRQDNWTGNDGRKQSKICVLADAVFSLETNRDPAPSRAPEMSEGEEPSTAVESGDIPF